MDFIIIHKKYNKKLCEMPIHKNPDLGYYVNENEIDNTCIKYTKKGRI